MRKATSMRCQSRLPVMHCARKQRSQQIELIQQSCTPCASVKRAIAPVSATATLDDQKIWLSQKCRCSRYRAKGSRSTCFRAVVPRDLHPRHSFEHKTMTYWPHCCSLVGKPCLKQRLRSRSQASVMVVMQVRISLTRQRQLCPNAVCNCLQEWHQARSKDRVLQLASPQDIPCS